MLITDLTQLLRKMQPVLNPGTYAFCVVPDVTDTATLSPLGTFCEAEGRSVIVAATHPPNTRTLKFSLRDPDSYYVTISSIE